MRVKKKENIISVVFGTTGLCFIILSNFLDAFIMNIIGKVFFLIGIIWYGKAKDRGWMYYVFFVPFWILFVIFIDKK